MVSLFEVFKKKKNKFIIHRHQADRAGLHYDIRLEYENVLKSWATKKIDLLSEAKEKKIMLFQTDDHDMSWINWSGEIKEGYGKGVVDIWDKGQYDIIRWTEKTKILDFNGNKLRGKFVIYHYKGNQYLMFPTHKY